MITKELLPWQNTMRVLRNKFQDYDDLIHQ